MLMWMFSRQQREASASGDLFERTLAHVSLWTLLVALVMTAVLIGTIRAALGDTDVRRLIENAVVCAVFIGWVRLLYARAGTLWAPFAAHALQNGLALVFGAAPASYIGGTPALVALLALSAVAMITFARRFWPALSGPLPPFLGAHAAAAARSSEASG
jgi:hypothetical protein